MRFPVPEVMINGRSEPMSRGAERLDGAPIYLCKFLESREVMDENRCESRHPPARRRCARLSPVFQIPSMDRGACPW